MLSPLLFVELLEELQVILKHQTDVVDEMCIRDSSPGGLLIVLTAALRGSISQHLVIIVYGVDYQGI